MESQSPGAVGSGEGVTTDEPTVATASRRSAASSHAAMHEEYLFELAPLGPTDLLSQCQEGPGNWWGDVDEDCLRVDDGGRVVLVDPEIYYEVNE